MIELLVKKYLEESLPNLKVYAEDEPAGAPEEFLLVKRTGSSKAETMKSASIAIECYSTSTYNAACLCEIVEDTMEKIVSLDEIAKVSFTTSYKDNDVARKRHRYRSMFEISLF